jgi:quinol monooxygenase YgiN
MMLAGAARRHRNRPPAAARFRQILYRFWRIILIDHRIRRNAMNITAHSLAVVAIFRARAGQREELGRQLLALVAPTRREAGSVLYEICQSERNADEWVAIEYWRDRAAFDFHMNTPYIKSFLDCVPQMCEEAPDIRFHTVRSEGNA